MSEVKHTSFTPGPWTPATEVLIRGSDGPSIGFVNCEPGSERDREARANLHLIGAAPELLAALKDCVGRFVQAFPDAATYGPIVKAYAAIAKAEGRADD